MCTKKQPKHTKPNVTFVAACLHIVIVNSRMIAASLKGIWRQDTRSTVAHQTKAYTHV